MKSIVISTMACAFTSAMDIPEDRCCILYSEKDFKGRFINTFCLNESENEAKFNLPDDYSQHTTESVSCGKSIAFRLDRMYET